MASTIPCLRPFLASFFTGFGAMGGETVIAGSQVGSGSGSHSRGEKGGSSYALGSMQSSSGDSSSAAGMAKKSKRRSRTGQTTVGAYVRERDNFSNNRQNRAQVSHDPALVTAPPRATTPSSFSAATANNASKHSTMMTMMGTGSGLAAADASSIASNESQKMIIKKEVQWHVDSEKGEEGTGGTAGVPRGL